MVFHKQKIVEKDHVINLIDRKDENESEKELKERKSASKAVPNRDYADAKNHNKTKRHEHPSDCPCTVKQFFLSRYQRFLCFLRRRRKKFRVLNKRNCRKHH